MSEDVVLSSEERASLADCERTIESHLLGQFEIGAALAIINASRLYRESHATFEEYVAERWDLQRGYAYQLMAAAALKANLAKKFETLPANEFQSRPLTKLSPKDQRTVWGQVVKQAGPGGSTPYKIVKGAVDDLLEARKVSSASNNDDAADHDQQGENQFRHGDPLQLLADVPQGSCDLLLVGELSGSTAQKMAANLVELLKVSSPAMKADHQVFVVVDLHDIRLLLDAAESLAYECGVPLIWVTDHERSIADWSAKISTRYILHLRQGTAGLSTQIGNAIICNEEKFKRHPDQRPLALIRTLIEIATKPGEMVLDPTAVAATANIACRQTSRGCIGIAGNETAYAAGLERLEETDGVEDNQAESN